MAKLKIYESQLAVKKTQLPDVGALALPFSLAKDQGDAFQSFFKDVSDIRKSRKKTQDQNDARKIILEVDKDIQKKFSTYQTSSNEDHYKAFIDNTKLSKYSGILTGHNKEVKALVGDHIFKEQTDHGTKLYAKILKNHIDETKLGHDKDLNKILFKMAANDDLTRSMGYREFTSWFNNSLNAQKYTKAEFQKLHDDKLALARKLQLQFQIRNDPMSVINNIDEIKEEFGKDGGTLILDKAAKSFVSKEISKDLDEIQAEKADTKQKIYNFAEVLKRLNNKNDPDYIEKLPTLDDINDLFKLDQINSAQYAALLDFYDNPEKISNDRVFDMIVAQYAVAKSVEDIDALERQINFDPEFVTQLNINDFSAFKEIFEKYKNNQPGMLTNQHFLKKLDTNLGKIENSGGYSLGKSKTDESGMQLTRIDGLKMYNDLIRKNVAPGDAYIQTLNAYKNEITLPTIYQIVQPTSIKIFEPTKGAVKDPEKFFEDKRLEVLEKYKAGTASMETFQDDLSAIDIIEDYYKVRQSIGGPVFGFASEAVETAKADTSG